MVTTAAGGVARIAAGAAAEAESATIRNLRGIVVGLEDKTAKLEAPLKEKDLAIEEGATLVRVGRAVFGERP